MLDVEFPSCGVMLVLKEVLEAGHCYFMPAILPTQEAEIRRIMV
jgi:hypothetical protein